jgi:hypothetical protein
MGRKVSVFVLLMLSLVSAIGGIRFFVTPGKATQLPYPGYPFIGVYPDNVTVSVNETFTLSVIVYNLTNAWVEDPYRPLTQIPLGNLYAFDVELSWNKDVIHCIDHTVTTPFESYPTPISPSPYAGILHGYGEPENKTLVTVQNVVNESGNIHNAYSPDVMGWFSYSTMTPALVFNGNGTICTMTFKVLKKGQSPVQIVYALLSDSIGNAIGYSLNGGAWLNPLQSGTVKTAGAPSIMGVSYSPSVGVVNKPVYFSASVTGNDTPVATYMWDFGDKTGVENWTTPVANHTYTLSGTYIASLRVVDVDGAESGNFTMPLPGVMVATSRDLKVASVTLSQSVIRPNRTLTVSTMVDNLGTAGFTFYENCTLSAYYNASALDGTTTWVQTGASNMSIPSGVSNFEQASFSLNSSSLPEIEAYYYFKLNVTGIPSGYEANTTNNVKVSSALLYTNATTHQVSIDDLACGYKSTATSKPTLPVIEGEYSNVSIVVRNAGNDYDKFNVTLYVNNSVTKTWTTSLLGAGKSQTFNWGKIFDVGSYNLTAVASGGNVSKSRSEILTVIKTPSLVVDYSPPSPVVGQEVTINGSRSIHQDPGGNITKYVWKIFAPGVPISGTPNATFSGSSLTVINLAFNSSGKWTVLLTVTDNYKLTYDPKRSATSAYQVETVIDVASPGGLTVEVIIGIVVVAAVIVVAAVLILRRKRRSKPSV